MPIPVVLIGGASGSGKSFVARAYGRPHVELDHFYRAQAEHAPEHPLPVTDYGEIDWDHPGTWNADRAVSALIELTTTGRARIPVYSIARSAPVGETLLTCSSGPVAAEGLFASEILASLRERGVAVQAYYIMEPPAWTALRRFVRDVREARKPLPFLVKRGWRLYRADAELRERFARAGFELLPKPEVKRRLAALTPAAA